MTKQLEITPEIHQAWIDVEKQMANFDGDDHAAVISHNYIGEAIYGKNLSAAKNYIYLNSNKEITIDDLKSKASEKPKEAKKESTKNAFGLSRNGDLASGADMTETFENENKEPVKRLTARISAAELQGWLEEKIALKNKK
jgi:hypothetical protein